MLKDWNEYSFMFDWEMHAISSHQLNDYRAWLQIDDNIGGKALEIGCGTGRISREFAKQGKNITAIDLSHNMINKFKKECKSIPSEKILCGDMLTYDFPEKYNLVFYSYSTFQYILTMEDQIKALTHIAKYLEPKGYVGIDVCPYTCDLPIHQPKTLLYKRQNKEINKQVSMYTSHRVDRLQQITNWQDTYVLEDSKKREVFSHNLSLKGMRLDYLQLLLKHCGFKLVEAYGDFDLNEVTPESDNIIYLAQKLD